MRALMIALVLALATAIPAFADDDDGAYTPSTPTTIVDLGGPAF